MPSWLIWGTAAAGAGRKCRRPPKRPRTCAPAGSHRKPISFKGYPYLPWRYLGRKHSLFSPKDFGPTVGQAYGRGPARANADGSNGGKLGAGRARQDRGFETECGRGGGVSRLMPRKTGGPFPSVTGPPRLCALWLAHRSGSKEPRGRLCPWTEQGQRIRHLMLIHLRRSGCLFVLRAGPARPSGRSDFCPGARFMSMFAMSRAGCGSPPPIGPGSAPAKNGPVMANCPGTPIGSDYRLGGICLVIFDRRRRAHPWYIEELSRTPPVRGAEARVFAIDESAFRLWRGCRLKQADNIAFFSFFRGDEKINQEPNSGHHGFWQKGPCHACSSNRGGLGAENFSRRWEDFPAEARSRRPSCAGAEAGLSPRRAFPAFCFTERDRKSAVPLRSGAWGSGPGSAAFRQSGHNSRPTRARTFRDIRPSSQTHFKPFEFRRFYG